MRYRKGRQALRTECATAELYLTAYLRKTFVRQSKAAFACQSLLRMMLAGAAAQCPGPQPVPIASGA